MRQLFDTCESCPWAHLFETSVYPFLKFNELIQVDRCLHKSVFPSPFQFPPLPFCLFLTSPLFIHPSFLQLDLRARVHHHVWAEEPWRKEIIYCNGVTYRERRVERAEERI